VRFTPSISLRQSEIEGCSFSDFAFRPDFSSMAADDSLYCCQAYSRSRKFIYCMKTLKGAE
jgi:hypothetical protein